MRTTLPGVAHDSPKHPPRFLQLTAIAAGDRATATERVRQAFNDAGAWITDVHFFSGLHTAFTFDVSVARLSRLQSALAEAGITLDEESRAALQIPELQGLAELSGTIAIIYAQGEGDVRRKIPDVPG